MMSLLDQREVESQTKQSHPKCGDSAAKRGFLICRVVTLRVRPLARVTGAGAGVGLEPAVVSEASVIVADLAEQAGTDQSTLAGEAGDDLGVRVGVEGGDGGLGEVLRVGAGRVQGL